MGRHVSPGDLMTEGYDCGYVHCPYCNDCGGWNGRYCSNCDYETDQTDADAAQDDGCNGLCQAPPLIADAGCPVHGMLAFLGSIGYDADDADVEGSSRDL